MKPCFRFPRPWDAGKYLVLWGDSFTFGESVIDQHTSSYFLQSLVSDYQVINMGIPGGGPNTALDELGRNGPRLGDLAKKSGISVFVYTDPQLERVVCRGDCMSNPDKKWTHSRPWVVYRAAGGVEVAGTHEDHIKRLWEVNPFDWIVFHSHLLSYLNAGWPAVEGKESVELLADIMPAVRDMARQRLGLERFLFVIYPTGNPTNKLVAEAVRRKGIDVIDYSDRDMSAFTDQRPSIHGDGHPHPRANFVFAHWLYDDLFQMNQARSN